MNEVVLEKAVQKEDGFLYFIDKNGNVCRTLMAQMLKQVKPITMSPEKAKREWKKYLKLVKEKSDQHIKDLKQLYYQLSKKHKIIDIYEAFKIAGLNSKKEPRFAICRADLKEVRFTKSSNGSGYFEENRWNSQFRVSLPNETFGPFKLVKGSTWEIEEPKELVTKVPIVPADKMPKGKLKDYYILWEVNEWKEIPKDPFLLKRITRNLFAIVATWDLTKLEQALIRGR